MTKMKKEIYEQPKILSSIYESNYQTLKNLSVEYNRRKITHITLAGRGTSDFACVFGQYLFGSKLGASVSLAQPSVITVYGGQPDFSNDLVMAVSQSGYAADALAVLEEAKKQGAVTVSITNDGDSPLAKAAEFSLLCYAGKEESVAATKTFTSEMALMYLFCASCGPDSEMLKDFSAMIFILEKFIKERDHDIMKLAESYTDMTHGFILSRGFGYSVALEATLKLQETCYIEMKGFAISDFYHGPLAQVDADTKIIIYVASGKVEKDVREIIEKLNSIGNKPLVVTNSCSIAEGLCADLFLVPSAGNEILENFVFAAFAQLFANHLSVNKGLNPDVPRNLKKVTVTK